VHSAPRGAAWANQSRPRRFSGQAGAGRWPRKSAQHHPGPCAPQGAPLSLPLPLRPAADPSGSGPAVLRPSPVDAGVNCDSPRPGLLGSQWPGRMLCRSRPSFHSRGRIFTSSGGPRRQPAAARIDQRGAAELAFLRSSPAGPALYVFGELTLITA